MSAASPATSAVLARCDSDHGTLGGVLVCRPDARSLARGGAQPAHHGYRARVDARRAMLEWDSFVQSLSDAGIVVHRLEATGPAAREGLANLHFTRDLAAVIDGVCVLARPATPSRRSEARIAGAALASLGLVVRQMRSTIEFGDVALGDDALIVVGVGGRTSASAVAELRHRLAGDRRDSAWLTLDISDLAGDVRFAHLDLCLGLLDGGRALVYPPLLGLPAMLRRGRSERRGQFGELLEEVGVEPLALSETQQRLGGANVLSLDPGNVLACRGAVRDGLDELLRGAGIRVRSFEGEQLLRSGGGPRCLSMPLWRA